MTSPTSSCRSSRPWGCRSLELHALCSALLCPLCTVLGSSELFLRPMFMHSQLWKWTTRWSQMIARPAGRNASRFADSRWHPPSECYTEPQTQDKGLQIPGASVFPKPATQVQIKTVGGKTRVTSGLTRKMRYPVPQFRIQVLQSPMTQIGEYFSFRPLIQCLTCICSTPSPN